jgi:hypothetical protein
MSRSTNHAEQAIESKGETVRTTRNRKQKNLSREGAGVIMTCCSGRKATKTYTNFAYLRSRMVLVPVSEEFALRFMVPP